MKIGGVLSELLVAGWVDMSRAPLRFFKSRHEGSETIFNVLDGSLSNAVVVGFADGRVLLCRHLILVPGRLPQVHQCLINHSPNRGLFVPFTSQVGYTRALEEFLDPLYGV